MRLDLQAPHQVYKNKAGKRVPGVTTTCNVYAKDLLDWTAGSERRGIIELMGGEVWTASQLEAALPVNGEGKPAYFAHAIRDKAGDLGTIAHAHLHAFRRGELLDPDGLDPSDYAQGHLLAIEYLERLDSEGFICTATELQMVSESLQVGGTGDQFGTLHGELGYRDCKTSKPWAKGVPYDENIAQACGYAVLYEEVTGEKVKWISIDRIGKTLIDKGDYWRLTNEQRRVGERLFRLGVESYYTKRELGNALKP